MLITSRSLQSFPQREVQRLISVQTGVIVKVVHMYYLAIEIYEDAVVWTFELATKETPVRSQCRAFGFSQLHAAFGCHCGSGGDLVCNRVMLKIVPYL